MRVEAAQQLRVARTEVGCGSGSERSTRCALRRRQSQDGERVLHVEHDLKHGVCRRPIEHVLLVAARRQLLVQHVDDGQLHILQQPREDVGVQREAERAVVVTMELEEETREGGGGVQGKEEAERNIAVVRLVCKSGKKKEEINRVSTQIEQIGASCALAICFFI